MNKTLVEPVNPFSGICQSCLFLSSPDRKKEKTLAQDKTLCYLYEYQKIMHIVLVEDNTSLAQSILRVLGHEGYATTHFEEGMRAQSWLTHHKSAYDLVVLDVLLPSLDGFTICRNLRNAQICTPVLMLTSKNMPEDAVAGLDSGADDYLRKPFVFDELLARIRSLLRRQPETVKVRFRLSRDVEIDMLSRQVFKKGEEVTLTAKEFAILNYFVQHPNTIINQQELYDHVFDFAEVHFSNTVEVHIKNLRKKLSSHHEKIPLTTLRGAGYRLDLQ